jgi:hypothetical protein
MIYDLGVRLGAKKCLHGFNDSVGFAIGLCDVKLFAIFREGLFFGFVFNIEKPILTPKGLVARDSVIGRFA